jgi:hypothetical protein
MKGTQQTLGVLSTLQVGESTWIETTLKSYESLRKRTSTPARFPKEIKHMRFSSRLYTAVSCTKAGDVRYLARFKRLEDGEVKW